ncbi:Zinc finger CCHC domain-containing protein 9 [Abortiporus biennis]
MTRYTNVARKRTYVQAGFDHEDACSHPVVTSSLASTSHAVQSDNQKAENSNSNQSQDKVEGDSEKSHREGKRSNTKASKGKQKLKEKRKFKDPQSRKFASEKRRIQRQDDRMANTICYACRETGHAARHCRNAPAILEDGQERPSGGKKKANRSMVGICYRCGSTQHNLSRCRASVEDPSNPLPFASCFVCSGKGHLASNCPQNASKGVYPNGGCCKLCGETSHLAKNCQLRKEDVSSKTILLGTGREAGADEDDFHTFKRKTAEISREEKGDERRKKMQNIKMGVHSGVVKSFGQAAAPKPKKIVTF